MALDEESDKAIKPHWLVLCNGVIVMVLCGILVWGSAYESGKMSNVFVLCGSLIIIPVMIILATKQFDSIHRRNPDPARFANRIYIIIAVFSIFAFVSNLIEGIRDEGFSIDYLIYYLRNIGLWFIGVFAYALFCIIVNLRWTVKLEQGDGVRDCAYSIICKPRRYRLIWAFYAVLAFSGFLAGHLVGEDIRFAEHVDRVNWLPETASNISYHFIRDMTAYEFDIQKEDFLELAKSRFWKVSEITEPFTIKRYTWVGNLINQSEIDLSVIDQENCWVVLDQGYYYEKQSGADFTAVGYDFLKGRAYYCGWHE